MSKEPNSILPTIHILTRSGNRPQSFSNLKQSLEEQSYKNYIHYISNDNKDCTFLKNEKNVINVYHLKKKKKGFRHCPYNLYINELVEEVKDGWIIIIDDDAKFINNNFLFQLSRICRSQSKKKIIIYKTYIGPGKTEFPSSIDLDLGTVDMSNICIHSSVLKKFLFNDSCCGDYHLIRRLKIDNFQFYFPKVLSRGIWANYCGKRNGR